MPEREPTLERVMLTLCSLCLDGIGGECHTAGCALYAQDLELRSKVEWSERSAAAAPALQEETGTRELVEARAEIARLNAMMESHEACCRRSAELLRERDAARADRDDLREQFAASLPSGGGERETPLFDQLCEEVEAAAALQEETHERGSLGRHVEAKSAEVDVWPASRKPAYVREAEQEETETRELPQNPTPIEWASAPVADRIRDAIHNPLGHAMGGTLNDLVEAAVIGMAEAGLIARRDLAGKTDAHHRGLVEFEEETVDWFYRYARKLDPSAMEADAEPRDVVQAALDRLLAAASLPSGGGERATVFVDELRAWIGTIRDDYEEDELGGVLDQILAFVDERSPAASPSGETVRCTCIGEDEQIAGPDPECPVHGAGETGDGREWRAVMDEGDGDEDRSNWFADREDAEAIGRAATAQHGYAAWWLERRTVGVPLREIPSEETRA